MPYSVTSDLWNTHVTTANLAALDNFIPPGQVEYYTLSSASNTNLEHLPLIIDIERV